VLLVLALAAWSAIAWLGRLNATGQDLENTAQSAARAASQQTSPADAETAASRAVSLSNLASPCTDQPATELTWQPGPTGTWRGGSVTVTLTCTIDNAEPFSGQGRTVSASDTQVIDRFQQATP
jgi:Flp pilus assembly protein TadG